jgi:hypothetical protein
MIFIIPKNVPALKKCIFEEMLAYIRNDEQPIAK